MSLLDNIRILRDARGVEHVPVCSPFLGSLQYLF